MGKVRHYFNALTLGGLVALSGLTTSCSSSLEERAVSAVEDYKAAVENYNQEVAVGNRLSGVFLVNETKAEVGKITLPGTGQRNTDLAQTKLSHVQGADTTDITVLGYTLHGQPMENGHLMHNAAKGALNPTEGWTGEDAALASIGSGNKEGTGKININKDSYSIRVLSTDQVQDLIDKGFKLNKDETYGFAENAPSKGAYYAKHGIRFHEPSK